MISICDAGRVLGTVADSGHIGNNVPVIELCD
jgi:hypothetical protein